MQQGYFASLHNVDAATSIFCLQLSSTRMRGGGLQILEACKEIIRIAISEENFVTDYCNREYSGGDRRNIAYKFRKLSAETKHRALTFLIAGDVWLSVKLAVGNHN